jgi:hypothetical protein
MDNPSCQELPLPGLGGETQEPVSPILIPWLPSTSINL